MSVSGATIAMEGIIASRRSALTTGGGQVHVYLWSLDGQANTADYKLLSTGEAARAERFLFAKHRTAYVVAHAKLRRTLGAYCGWSASELIFDADVFGKPRIIHPQTELSFNLSHTEGLCALAVGWKHPLGIDIERIRAIDRDVAVSHFSMAEMCELDALGGEQWLRGFYRCWTSKEAILKAEGAGLSTPLDSFDVEVKPDVPPRLIKARTAARLSRDWHLYQFEPAAGVAGTLAMAEVFPVLIFQLG